MRKSLFHVLGATAVLAAALLTTTAASAAPHARAAPAPPTPALTTVTFTVTSGDLTITALGSASLGTGLPGNAVAGFLGKVTVTDDRAALDATWAVSASSTDFTTGSGPTLSTIPVADGGYDPNAVTISGAITATPKTITLSGTPQGVVGTVGTGNNTATWDPAISVDLPAAAVGGGYTSTLTQSVA